MRLLFAVATAVTPEILLLDEWFSTGDAEFQEKSLGRLRQMMDRTHITVLASHDHTFCGGIAIASSFWIRAVCRKSRRHRSHLFEGIMHKPNLEEFIESFLTACDFVQEVRVTGDTRFDEMPDFDSLAMLGVIIMMEGEYGTADYGGQGLLSGQHLGAARLRSGRAMMGVVRLDHVAVRGITSAVPPGRVDNLAVAPDQLAQRERLSETSACAGAMLCRMA
ncbi:hypothetical protein [Bordetella holmesii]|uniref:hypothetical protein n=1 Tax=Bordetella holmesii TaxID=35814 RepID=UPI001E55A68B|nr:hypothetical protein [Bordetella holmesii]